MSSSTLVLLAHLFYSFICDEGNKNWQAFTKRMKLRQTFVMFVTWHFCIQSQDLILVSGKDSFPIINLNVSDEFDSLLQRLA